MSTSSDTWYHGSPHTLSHLQKGSTITQDRRLAEVFSHKPRIVSDQEDGLILHNGTSLGYLYKIAEKVNLEDISPVPLSTMQPGKEFLTLKEFLLEFLYTVDITKDELLSEGAIKELLHRYDRKDLT